MSHEIDGVRKEEDRLTATQRLSVKRLTVSLPQFHHEGQTRLTASSVFEISG